MQRWRLFLMTILLGALCACAAPQGGPSSPGDMAAAVKAPPVEAGELPCAVTASGTALSIGYPAESIYQGGAVLPKEEGLACLDGLTGWLKSRPQSRWQVTVFGEDGHGFEPLALAGKRQEMLQRLLTRKGIALEGWEWQTAAGQGDQLRLVELKAAP